MRMSVEMSDDFSATVEKKREKNKKNAEEMERKTRKNRRR